MFAPRALIEELARVASQVAESFDLVFDCVALDEVHDDGKSHFVGLVDELLQFVGGAEAAGRRKETRHVVAETAIVGVFLNGHDLEAIVSVLDDARQDVLAEFVVGPDLFGVLGHADVAFVDKQRGAFGAERLLLEHVGVGGIPHLGTENFSLVVLNHTLAPGRYAFAATAVPVDLHFVEVQVFERLEWELDFPVAGSLNTV